MTTIHSLGGKGSVAFIKGAPEVLLERCTHILEEGEVRELTAEKNPTMEVDINRFELVCIRIFRTGDYHLHVGINI